MIQCSSNQGWAQEVVPNPDLTTLGDDEVAFLEAFPRYAPTAAQLCTAAGLNHHILNHTTRQGHLQGSTLKVAKAAGLAYPRGHSTSDQAVRDRTTKLLYAADHPVAKRNMLYILDPEVPNLTAAWLPGAPQPTTSSLDDFVQLRTNSIPAGARKIYVAIEACKKITSCGLLVSMPQANSSSPICHTVGGSQPCPLEVSRKIKVDREGMHIHNTVP